MKPILLLFSVIYFCNSQALSFTQMHSDEDTTVSKKKDTGVITSEMPIVFMDVDQPAQFKYGNDSLGQILWQNVEYPDSLSELGISGKTIVQFIVERDGTISNVKIAKSSGQKLFDNEAQRVIKLLSGLFIPAQVNGRPVRSYCQLPISFVADE